MVTNIANLISSNFYRHMLSVDYIFGYVSTAFFGAKIVYNEIIR